MVLRDAVRHAEAQPEELAVREVEPVEEAQGDAVALPLGELLAHAEPLEEVVAQIVGVAVADALLQPERRDVGVTAARVAVGEKEAEAQPDAEAHFEEDCDALLLPHGEVERVRYCESEAPTDPERKPEPQLVGDDEAHSDTLPVEQRVAEGVRLPLPHDDSDGVIEPHGEVLALPEGERLPQPLDDGVELRLGKVLTEAQGEVLLPPELQALTEGLREPLGVALGEEEGEGDTDTLAQTLPVAQLEVEADAQPLGETLPEAARTEPEMLGDAVGEPETLPLALNDAQGVELPLCVRDGEGVAHSVPVGCMRVALMHAEAEMLKEAEAQGVTVAQGVAVGVVESVLLAVEVVHVLGEADSVVDRVGLAELEAQRLGVGEVQEDWEGDAVDEPLAPSCSGEGLPVGEGAPVVLCPPPMLAEGDRLLAALPLREALGELVRDPTGGLALTLSEGLALPQAVCVELRESVGEAE